MTERIMEILKDGEAVTTAVLAQRLNVSYEVILANMEFLERSGAIVPVLEDYGCDGDCEDCPSCQTNIPELAMWKIA